MKKFVTALLAFACLALMTNAKAEEWPTRRLTMLNPFAAEVISFI